MKSTHNAVLTLANAAFDLLQMYVEWEFLTQVRAANGTRERGCCSGLWTHLLWLLAALGYAASNALGLAWLVEDLAGLYQQSPGLGTVALGVIAGIVAGLLTVLGFCVRRFPKIAKNAAKGAAAFCGCPAKLEGQDGNGQTATATAVMAAPTAPAPGTTPSPPMPSWSHVEEKGGGDTVVLHSAPELLWPDGRRVQA